MKKLTATVIALLSCTGYASMKKETINMKMNTEVKVSIYYDKNGNAESASFNDPRNPKISYSLEKNPSREMTYYLPYRVGKPGIPTDARNTLLKAMEKACNKKESGNSTKN